MTIKKNKNYQDYSLDIADIEQYNQKKKPQEKIRRQIKNYKKVWEEHADDYEDFDEFFSK